MPYTIKKYQRTPSHVAPEELKAVHPLGTAPVITDGAVTLAESGAIIGTESYAVTSEATMRLELNLAPGTLEYIIRKYGDGKVRPPASGEVDDLYCEHHSSFETGYLPGRQLVRHSLCGGLLYASHREPIDIEYSCGQISIFHPSCRQPLGFANHQ